MISSNHDAMALLYWMRPYMDIHVSIGNVLPACVCALIESVGECAIVDVAWRDAIVNYISYMRVAGANIATNS
jgi:hypothetical protein